MAIPNLWEPYGLKASPFFQEELRSTDAAHPTTLFVGREQEIRRLEQRIASDRATRTIIQGEAGVGKTSLVNRIKANAQELGAVPFDDPIRIAKDSTVTTVVADALRTILRIRLSLGIATPHRGTWSRITRWLEGEEIHGGSISALGFGAGVSRSVVTARAPAEPLYDHLSFALTDTNEALGRTVLLHVNNLENLTPDRSRELALLLRDLRDYLLLPAHWIFVGTTGIENDLFRVHDQVGGIFPTAVTLLPLPPETVEDLLRLRYRHLQTPGAPLVEPIAPRDAAALYGLYQGDLRNFLRLLSDAAEMTLGLGGPRPMTMGDVVQNVSGEYARRLAGLIGDANFRYLASIAAAMPEQRFAFRVTDAAKATGLSQPSATKLVERLLTARVIRESAREGRSVFYRPTGEALVALGCAPD
jgi:hypothetical protein